MLKEGVCVMAVRESLSSKSSRWERWLGRGEAALLSRLWTAEEMV